MQERPGPGIMKNKFRPIIPSQHKKKENVRLRFGQPMVSVALPETK